MANDTSVGCACTRNGYEKCVAPDEHGVVQVNEVWGFDPGPGVEGTFCWFALSDDGVFTLLEHGTLGIDHAGLGDGGTIALDVTTTGAGYTCPFCSQTDKGCKPPIEAGGFKVHGCVRVPPTSGGYLLDEETFGRLVDGDEVDLKRIVKIENIGDVPDAPWPGAPIPPLSNVVHFRAEPSSPAPVCGTPWDGVDIWSTRPEEVTCRDCLMERAKVLMDICNSPPLLVPEASREEVMGAADSLAEAVNGTPPVPDLVHRCGDTGTVSLCGLDGSKTAFSYTTSWMEPASEVTCEDCLSKMRQADEESGRAELPVHWANCESPGLACGASLLDLATRLTGIPEDVTCEDCLEQMKRDTL